MTAANRTEGLAMANPSVLFASWPRYTGKERDAETNLDYFGARYFSGAQGRFTSPDTPLVDQNHDDPQSWNLYTYGRNNPLGGVDHDGHIWHILAGAAGGYVVGGGIELGKQLIRGESVDLQKVNAKGMNGAIVGGTAAATGGMSVLGAGLAMGAAGAMGGVVERASDGDDATIPLDHKLVITDTVVGGAFGAAGQYARNVGVEAAKKTGEVTRAVTRGESLMRQGAAAGDAAKVAKGAAIKASGSATAVAKTGNPGSVALTVKQETVGEMTSTLRKEELERQGRHR
jgi:RHS repeat-associated protein